MAQDIALDYLLISDKQDLPFDELSQKLQSMRLGMLDSQLSPPAEHDPFDRVTRTILGTIAIHETLGRADATIVMARYQNPVMNGLSPASLDALTATLTHGYAQILRKGTLSIDLHIQGMATEHSWRLQWASALLTTLAQLFDAVVFDPPCQRVLAPPPDQSSLMRNALDHIMIHHIADGPETSWIHTHGMSKIGQPDLDIRLVPLSLEHEGIELLQTVISTLSSMDAFDENQLRQGMRIDASPTGWLFIRHTQPDAEHISETGRFLMVSTAADGSELRRDATGNIVALALHKAKNAIEQRRWQEATRMLEKITVAMPDHPGALLLQARIALAQGNPQMALGMGEYLINCAPDHFAGYYIVGLALQLLGRSTEAYGMLSRAIHYNPDDIDCYTARSITLQRLGRYQEAQSDVLRAAMLKKHEA